MKILKIIWNVVSTTVIVVLTLIAVFNLACYVKKQNTGEVCPTVLGHGIAVVISGSMAPEIQVDDLVVFAKTDDYGMRDVVVYEGNTYPVTHRIVAMRTDDAGKTWVTTRGDANNTDDDEFPADRIVGEVVLVIPKVGKVQTFLQSPLGMLMLMLVAVALVVSVEIGEMIRRNKIRRSRRGW